MSGEQTEQQEEKKAFYTVADLMADLAGCPPDARIVLSSDGEGNSIRYWDGDVCECRYDKEDEQAYDSDDPEAQALPLAFTLYPIY